MITVRAAGERGRASQGWLDSRHTFSFGEYQDPLHMGFGALRVINEDRVAPAAGFGTHGHRDMEIISYVLEGALEHKDSIGTGSVIRPGDVQVMSAGTGIRHSEFNPAPDAPVHFLQIWIVPDRTGIAPRYAQKSFPDAAKRARLCLVLSQDGRDGSLVVHQDVDVHATLLQKDERVALPLRAGRRAWVQVLRGSALVNGVALATGDGAGAEQEAALALQGAEDGTEALLFDMA